MAKQLQRSIRPGHAGITLNTALKSMKDKFDPTPPWEYLVLYILALGLFVLGAWAIAAGQYLGIVPFGLGLWTIFKL